MELNEIHDKHNNWSLYFLSMIELKLQAAVDMCTAIQDTNQKENTTRWEKYRYVHHFWMISIQKYLLIFIVSVDLNADIS